MSWTIEDTRHDAALESVFAVGNGYLGVRGAPEEGAPAYDAGTVLNGFHETWPIVYPEDAYGLARTGQTIVAPPDGSVVRLFADGEPVDVTTARVRRVLDMRAGVLRREVELETAGGARLRIRSRRLASLVRRNLVAIDYEVTVLSGAADVVLSSELRPHEEAAADDDPRRHKGFAERPLDPVAAETLGPRVVLDARHAALRAHARVRDGQRLRRRDVGDDQRRRRRRARGGRRHPGGRRHAAAAQVRRLSLDCGRGARPHGRPRPPHARPRAARGLRGGRAGALGTSRGVLGAQ